MKKQAPDAHTADARRSGNLFEATRAEGDAEIFTTLFENDAVRVERIVSPRHSGEDENWYDQDEDEWVMVVRGEATLVFADGRHEAMGPGDWIAIPARCRHRVAAVTHETVWIAVHARA